MSQFVDFVGLNTFIYEANGFFDIGQAAGDGYASVEFVSTDGLAGATGYVFTYPNTIGSFGFTQGGLPYTYLANIDPRSEDYYRFSYRDIRSLMNKKYDLYLSASRVPGIASSASYFPALMLKRNGPYGHPMFKQIRVHENPLTRKQIKEGIFTIVETPSPELIRTFGPERQTQTIRSRYGNIIQYREGPLTSKYKPLDWLVGMSPDNEKIDNQQDLTVDNIERVVMRNSYGNDINFFINADLNNRLGLEVSKDEDYEKITNLYLDGGLDSDGSPLSTFEFLKYSETIFPREVNTYRKIARKRFNFINSFWRDDRDDRSAVVTDKFGNNYKTTGGVFKLPSMWPLDADYNFATREDWITSSVKYLGFSDSDQTGELSGGAGILQNQYNQIANVELADLGVGVVNNELRASPIYSRRHTLAPYDRSSGILASANIAFRASITGSIVSPDGIFISETASAANLSYEPGGGVGVLGQGQALWEAGAQAGKNPFNSSYDIWYENLRLKAKDYSVVPEFTISSFVPTIEVSGALNFIDNMFEVTGGSSGELDLYNPAELAIGNDSSESKFYETYSTSDFMKHFAKIKRDHIDFIEPSKITLTCKAFKKFLAYDSFYPAIRTVDIATQFSNSYGVHISGNTTYSSKNPATLDAQALQTIMKPMMAPGILYNTIKSGLACDYPVFLDSYNTNLFALTASDDATPRSFWMNGFTGHFDTRIPFEAIYEPEKYLVNTLIASDEVEPQANIKSIASWDGSGDNLYKKMINNFLAETVDFFLEESELTFIASKQQQNFSALEIGKTYAMRIKVGKTYSGKKLSFEGQFGTYRPPNNYIEGSSFARENITMYSRPTAFGPPSVARPKGIGTVNSNDPFAVNVGGSTIGYNFPYTPPYYNGEAWCDVYFSASEGKKYTLDEILEGSTYCLTRVDPFSYASGSNNIRGATNVADYGPQGTGSSGGGTFSFGPQAGTAHSEIEGVWFWDYTDGTGKISAKSMNADVCRNAMQLISSINVKGKGTLDNSGRVRFTSFADGSPSDRWIIQTKFETPILNFNDVSITTNSSYDAQAPRGMWHQYGRMPTEEESIFLQVTDVPKDWGINFLGNDNFMSNTGSLADVCGFTTERRKIGKIASQKIIKEAVVAVPYVEQNGTKRFYSIGKDQVFNAKKFLESKRFETEGGRSPASAASSGFYKSQTTDSIINMVTAMDDYVFPPTMDFVHFGDNISPFAMYVFEFSHSLNQDDIKDIWQNLPPRIAESFEESQSTIEHPLFAKQFLSTFAPEQEGNTPTGGVLNEKIRWMVFKVKQRASKSYKDKTTSEGISKEIVKARRLFPNSIQEKRKVTENLLSYNWPYDFFSLVELVKIESQITFSNEAPDGTIETKGSPKKDKSSRTVQKNPSKPNTPAAIETPPTISPLNTNIASDTTPASSPQGPDTGRNR